ncbi:MAG TPA: histidine kinase dimerization/phosphoacceptor domain -containing protein [Woeseiaceae bacterium]|nr:histidine kinase dimerization/phosphoacceptor domain -containing protein [Woeseiaceae bacterium]
MDEIARLFQDPVFLVDRTGALLDLNRQAQKLLGGSTPHRAEEVFAPTEKLTELMSRASGTAEPVLGALSVRAGPEKLLRFRARALALRAGEGLRYAIQLSGTRRDEFTMLSRRIADLNREVASRRLVQSRLEEALARNTALMRELQHRANNNLQMVLGLVSMARRELAERGAGAVFEKVELRLRAICETQQLMYMDDDPSGVPAGDLVTSLAKGFASIAGKGVTIEADADVLRIPNDTAFSLGLMIVELLSNAAKHGTAASGGRIGVSLRRVGTGFELQVRDGGPGFTLSERVPPSSGLGLVRGLCRQLGGDLHISRDAGALVVIRLPRGC